MANPPRKIIVAIHGIGDQIRCETIQLVVRQFARYCAVQEGFPLGRLNAQLFPLPDASPRVELEGQVLKDNRLIAKLVPQKGAPLGPGAYLVQSPPFTGPLGFAEVYWADIPRGLASDHYELEEAKKWAVTLVERVRVLGEQQRQTLRKAKAEAETVCREEQARERGSSKAQEKAKEVSDLDRREKALPTDADYDLAADVIGEMIETVGVLQVLLYLLEKANLLSFDLDKVLVDYLGDVQVVAEFDNYRRKIVDVFHTVMNTIHEGLIREAQEVKARAGAEKDPAAKAKAEAEARAAEDAEIYIVAHSEGTVIAFRGILEALSRLEDEAAKGGEMPSAWVKRLRGLMTIGSPLNKHILLWPELFEQLTPPKSARAHPIQWVNYYDYGDPIGFELVQTKDWLEKNGWADCFQWVDDVGFTRYCFAGQAHLGYFEDEDVFGYFIEKVVQLPRDLTSAAKGKTARKPFNRPGDRWAAKLFSPSLPYVLATLLLFAGVFLLYKAVTAYTLPFVEPIWSVGRNVLAIGVLLAGVTAAVRIPRLTKRWMWRLTGFALLVAGFLLFPILLTPGAKFRLGSVFLIGKGTPVGNGLIASLDAAARWLPQGLSIGGPTLGILAFGLVITLLIYLLSRFRPRWGVYPLILTGAAAVLAIVGVRMRDARAHTLFVEARGALARRGLVGNRLDEASADLVDRYLRDPTTSGDPKAFVPFAADHSCQMVCEGEYQEDVCPIPPADSGAGPNDVPAAPVSDAATESRPIWPVLLAGAIFLYLWWLAAHVFDLIVIWQHYIRSSAIIHRLTEIRGDRPAPGSPQQHAAGTPIGR